MNWAHAIARNRTALLAVVAAIFGLVGREGGPVSRRVRNAALALLRPAEAAVRRLIVIAARGVVAAPRPTPDAAFRDVSAGDTAEPSGLARRPAFRLFDRQKRFGRVFRPLKPAGVPRIRTFFGPAVIAAAPSPAAVARPDPEAAVDAARLRLRLAALERALATLPHQARRLARWRARAEAKAARETAQASVAARRAFSPLRLGHPPGYRRPSTADAPDSSIDAVLRECHLLALDALAGAGPLPDTS
jgi:hypothetical protein